MKASIDMDLVKRATLDDWELARRKSELARIEQELADKEHALAEFKQQLEAFRARYFQALARPHAELDELEAQVAEKEAAVRPDDATKRRKAERLRAQADGRAIAQRAESAVTLKPKPPDALRQTYRALTKLVHPDLVSDPTERQRREAVMVQANAAYAMGDGDRLNYLLGAWEVETAATGRDSVEAALDRVMQQIAQARARLDAPNPEQVEAEQSGLAVMMRRSQLAERQGRDLLVRLVEEVEEAKREARKRLKTLDRRLSKAARGADAG